MKEVTVYSAPWCAGCKVVKSQLTANNIKYKEIDITTSEGGLQAKHLGIKGIPVTVITGIDKLFVGSTKEILLDIIRSAND